MVHSSHSSGRPQPAGRLPVAAQPARAAGASRMEAGSLSTGCAAVMGYTGWFPVGGPTAGGFAVVGLAVKEQQV